MTAGQDIHWTRKLLYAGVALGVGIVTMVLVLELAFGSWLFRDPWDATKSLNIVRNRTIEYSVESIYGSGAPKVRYTRDRHGLRGQCDDPRRIEVLTIGGSTTDQRYISDGQTYQDVLAQRARERLSMGLHVCNAGVDGQSTFGHLAAFDRWFPLIEGLRPRYVLLYIGINDAGFRLQPMPDRDPTRGGPATRWERLGHVVRERSALYGLDQQLKALFGGGAERLYARHGSNLPPETAYTVTAMTPGIEPLIAANVAGYEQRLEMLLARVHALGARPICMTQPHRLWNRRDDDPRGLPAAFEFDGVRYSGLDYRASKLALDEAMGRLCTGAGGEFIDMKVRHFERDDFYDPVHMTPAGARRLADYLFEEMQRRGLLDALRNTATDSAA